MQKIRNPYIGIEGYNCFGCSPGNEHGLQLEFTEDGDEITAVWKPKPFFQGYGGILHGGIQAALMDEIAGWTVSVKLKTGGMTSKLEVRYRKPVAVGDGNILLRSKVKEMRRNIAVIHTELFDQKGTLCSESDIFYFTLKPEEAREKLSFPEHKDFYFDETCS